MIAIEYRNAVLKFCLKRHFHKPKPSEAIPLSPLSRSRRIATDFPYVALHVADHAEIEISSCSPKCSTRAIEHVESARVFIKAVYRTRKATRAAIKHGIPKLRERNSIASFPLLPLASEEPDIETKSKGLSRPSTLSERAILFPSEEAQQLWRSLPDCSRENRVHPLARKNSRTLLREQRYFSYRERRATVRQRRSSRSEIHLMRRRDISPSIHIGMLLCRATN